jgi:phosphoribosylanthranilate isomerase
VRVKICGLTTSEQAAIAADAGVDFIGLVFAEHSLRRVTIHQAKEVMAGLPVPATVSVPSSASPTENRAPVRWFESSAQFLEDRLLRKKPLVVGVFTDMTATMVNAIADKVGLDLVQLSGHEPWEEALAIRRPVIKAVRIGPEDTAHGVLDNVEVGTANLCLLDTASAGQLGGSGRSFDWRIAAEIASEMPIMLAGGLTPENVGEAIRDVRPWGVDVSSGVEVDGVKDGERMRAFVTAVRAAQAGLE